MTDGETEQLLTEKPSPNQLKMLKPLRPVPKVAYERMKTLLKRHHSLHFFLHNTYCRLVLAYNPLPYEHFCSKLAQSGALRTKEASCPRLDSHENFTVIQ